MDAVVLRGRGEVAIEDVEDARLEAPTDALLRVTSTAICGTDLHFYGGRMNAEPGLTIGHEPLGVVMEVGEAVATVRPGDRVVVPTHICCGFCAMCVHGETASCLTNNPGQAGAAYGYPGMGGYRGAQADLVRVPFADANCLRLPGQPGDRWEDDFVLLADALPTGYHATVLAGVRLGASVAIYGAGSVGLLAALCAIQLRGPADVYVVDNVPERLDKAAELGAIPVDFSAAPPVDQIREHRAQLRRVPWRRGEEPLGGVDCAIDAVGFQARDRSHPSAENPLWVLDDLVELLNPNGRLGIIGVYPPSDPQGVLGEEGRLPVRWGPLFGKSIVVGTGRDHDERYNDRLRDLIVAGRIKPGTVVSHRLPLKEAPDAYRRFDGRLEGLVKVVLEPRGVNLGVPGDSPAVNEIRAESWARLQELLFADSWHAGLARHRSDFVFRGEASTAAKLTTSLQRLAGERVEVEPHLLRSFRKYAQRNEVPEDTTWHWLALAKHHGLPTRILDWTYSPYVALHFATAFPLDFERDGLIWMVDFVQTNRLLPRKLRNALEEEGMNAMSTDLLCEVAPTLGDFDRLGDDFVAFFEPPALDDRIVNQYALFSLMPGPLERMDRWLEAHPELARRIVLPAELKWEVRDKLDQANITERVLFPGLDGLAVWLKRYFSPRTPPEHG